MKKARHHDKGAYGKKIHHPLLIFNDVCCRTSCGMLWYRPKKRIRLDEVDCELCKKTEIFKDALKRTRKYKESL